MKRRQGLLLGLLVTLGSVGCWSSGKEPTRLEGAGSTFVDPMMQKWASLYNTEKSVQINYQAKGSGSGIKMMTDREVDFGCSDAPLNAEQLSKAEKAGGGVIHIPLCMGAIVPAYNLPGVDDLVFSGEVLLKIYLGEIKEWNHEAIKKLNPDKKLPPKEIAVAFRSDSSGSTYILTDYFTKIDKDAWKPGVGTAIQFPRGVGVKGNDGVAGYVKANEGAIGYVELIYAVNNHIAYGSVKNVAGKAVKGDMASVTAAAATAKVPDDLRYSITNAPGETAYPISGTVWALVYIKQPAAKVKPLTEFLTWVTHEGQKYCEKQHYASLPQVLVKKIEEKIKKIEAEK